MRDDFIQVRKFGYISIVGAVVKIKFFKVSGDGWQVCSEESERLVESYVNKLPVKAVPESLDGSLEKVSILFLSNLKNFAGVSLVGVT